MSSVSNEVKKRANNVNFSKREEELLVELVTANSQILENRKNRSFYVERKRSLLKET